jgi:hypothetical protein
VRLIGYVAGGLPGQRLLARLCIATSDDTVLRRIRQKPAEPVLPAPNLGVDDWAWRKGQEYGTILVNLNVHRVVDLLPDRASDSFSEWLRRHPEIATISRDRCGIYAEGASLGAPQSQQIAARFHLILNLSATMERVLEERSRKLILPPVDHAATESQTAPVSGAGTELPATAAPTYAVATAATMTLRALRAGNRFIQVRTLAGGDQPHTWTSTDHSPLAPARRVS